MHDVLLVVEKLDLFEGVLFLGRASETTASDSCDTRTFRHLVSHGRVALPSKETRLSAVGHSEPQRRKIDGFSTLYGFDSIVGLNKRRFQAREVLLTSNH